MNKNKYYHLSLKDRIIIEEELNEQLSFKKIAKDINKSPSSISKEVKRNFTIIKPSTFNNSFNQCEFKVTCQLKNICIENCGTLCKKCRKCNSMCEKFQKQKTCSKLLKPPYVCNGCSTRSGCRKEKFVYKAKEANEMSKELLINSRQGINKSPEELEILTNKIVPLIKKGHSMAVILMNNPDLNISEKTLYNYVNKWYINGIGNIDLPKKVKYKPRKKQPKEPADTINRKNREISDYLAYIEEHKSAQIVEIDTVEGIKGGKALFTIIFTNCNFMIAFLIDSQTKNEINKKMDELKNIFGSKFSVYFEVIITDNEKEFQDPDYIERVEAGANIHLFYCDPR